ncbi:MAG: cation-translocating P-type ATPase [Deltaproteobacteria bacterium]|nr:cation-translocating P-type ATPase [Deltaproteobacteria bacterium]
MMDMDWYQKTAEEVVAGLGTDALAGLGTDEAAARLAKHGPNALVAAKKESRVVRFLRQFTEFIIIVLIGAAVIAGFLGEWVDAAAIMTIVVLNGVIGFVQDEKAEAVLEALKKLAAPSAKVVRNGAAHTLPAFELVPGDVIIVEAGDSIPADCRIISSQSLRMDEASLTGESQAVGKDTGASDAVLPLADRTNMAYMSTHAVYGRGRAVVVATGMDTQIGRLAAAIQQVEVEPTPLQKRLAEFGRKLVYAAGFICVLVFILGLFHGEPLIDMFLTAVSLAVAAIPEGLPAVVTITLALGVQRMVGRNALVRRLPSVETLGSASVIASDKTGTLTQNQMTVRKLYIPGRAAINVSGGGYGPQGGFFEGGDEMVLADSPGLVAALKAGVLSSTAELKQTAEGGWTVVGDPTEGALLAAALKAGIGRQTALSGLTFVGEAPFDSERKMMTTVFKDNGNWYSFTKGAPEILIKACTHINENGVVRPITHDDKRRILRQNDELSQEALRVLGIAMRSSVEPIAVHDISSLESGLVFLGLAGMIDPPREEVFAAVAKAASAGITPIMITGDHKVTAVAIATELGIYGNGDAALTGAELDALSEGELANRLEHIKVYARASPEHKLRIVRAWRAKGEIIAMTGDGVNDAPALKEADIGVAMGITGTDVTKEAADMVLTDDNFASIVSAVEEGRGIFANIRKAVHFLLSCNIGEIFVLLAASLAGLPLPLLPVQILWTNLVTDGMPALALAMEPVEAGIMDRPPRPKDEGIVTRPLLLIMLVQGLIIGVCTLAAYVVELYIFGASTGRARTTAFAVLVFCQMFHVYNCRSMLGSAFNNGIFANRTLNMAVVLILATQLLIIYVPVLRGIFKTEALGFTDWAVIFAASIQPLVWMEVVKAAWPKGRKM